MPINKEYFARVEKRDAPLLEEGPPPSSTRGSKNVRGGNAKRADSNAGKTPRATTNALSSEIAAPRSGRFTLVPIPEKSSGIYGAPASMRWRLKFGARKPSRAELQQSRQDFRRFRGTWPAKSDASDTDFRVHLEQVKSWALKYFESLGGFPGLRETEDALEWYPLPPETLPISGERLNRQQKRHNRAFRDRLRAGRVGELLDEIDATLRELEMYRDGKPTSGKDLNRFALKMFQLGRRMEMVAISPFEEDARSGRKSREGGETGPERRENGSKFEREDWDLYQQTYDEIYNDHPNWKPTSICKHVAARFVSPLDWVKPPHWKTIRRHVVDPREK